VTAIYKITFSVEDDHNEYSKLTGVKGEIGQLILKYNFEMQRWIQNNKSENPKSKEGHHNQTL